MKGTRHSSKSLNKDEPKVIKFNAVVERLFYHADMFVDEVARDTKIEPKEVRDILSDNDAELDAQFERSGNRSEELWDRTVRFEASRGV